jgi:hypothetical protein
MKKSQNSRNQGFSYYYRIMTERSGSGSVPLTSGSGSLIAGAGLYAFYAQNCQVTLSLITKAADQN